MKERLIRQRELTARLNTYRDEYYNQNAPSVSDTVYDRLFDELTELEKETGVVMSNSPTQTVGYPVVSRLPQAKHDIPLLSLDKTKLISELLAFQDGRAVNFSLKLDGLTTEIIYEGGLLQRLSTRGDGDIGEDITHNAEAIEGIPVQIPYKERLVVAGESFIHCSDLNGCAKSWLTVRESRTETAAILPPAPSVLTILRYAPSGASTFCPLRS